MIWREVKMTLKEVKHYINFSVKEGYMSEEEAERLESLPKKEMIKEVEKMADRGDAAIEMCGGCNLPLDACECWQT